MDKAHTAVEGSRAGLQSEHARQATSKTGADTTGEQQQQQAKVARSLERVRREEPG